MGKHKKNQIPKNKDIEDIVYKEIEENQSKDKIIKNTQKQDFKEEIKVETTRQFKIAAQRRYERILAEDEDERRQIYYLKAVQKLQEEEMEI